MMHSLLFGIRFICCLEVLINSVLGFHDASVSVNDLLLLRSLLSFPRFEIFLVRHAFEQYLTWSQFLFKDFRHVKVLPQDTQVFLGCSAFMGCRFS